LQEDPKNPDYIIASFAYSKDKNEKDNKEIPGLNLNKEAYNLSLVFTDLLSSLELSRKDNVHLPNLDRFKYYTAKTKGEKVRDRDRDRV
jgi:hypothetical protein